MNAPHHFKDYRGLVQLRLQGAEDLEHLHDLEPARWSATSVPTDQLFVDPVLLELLDSDKNNRVRVHELQAAHTWLVKRLKNRARLADRSDTVRLADLDPVDDIAARLTQLVNDRLGKTDAVTLDEIRAFRASYTKKFPNGDGVVTAAQIEPSAEHLAERTLLERIVKDGGGALDASGEHGADEASLDAFFKRLEEMRAWEEQALATPRRPLGDDTAPISAAIAALEPKIEQFFAQCDLVGQEKAASARLEETVESLQKIDVKDAGAIRAHLKEASLAQPNAGGLLDVRGFVNPVFADELRALFAGPLARVLGQPSLETLSRGDWEKAKAALAAFREHAGKKPRALPDDLAGEALTAALAGAEKDALRARIVEDRRVSAELQGLFDLERLALTQRWLLDLANNMVSFPALFSGAERCLFEAGTLVLDGRELSFCVRVQDRAAHKPVAEQSNLFVVYADLDRREGDLTRTQHIAAAVTAGTRRAIANGKRGVFYDRDGKEWDARVTDIIVRPISLWEAATAPFRRLRDFVVERIEKLGASRLESMEKQATAGVDSKVTTVAAAAPIPGATPAPVTAPAAPPAPAPAAPPAPPPAPAGGGLQGLLVGGGLAFAAIGSALAFALNTLASLQPFKVLAVVGGVVVGIMMLSGFLGWLKLRKRDLSTMLEACGWAFNVRIYLTRRHSMRFTRVPPLPKGSVRERVVVPLTAADEGDGGRMRLLAAILVGVLVGYAAFRVFEEPITAALLRAFSSGG